MTLLKRLLRFDWEKINALFLRTVDFFSEYETHFDVTITTNVIKL